MNDITKTYCPFEKHQFSSRFSDNETALIKSCFRNYSYELIRQIAKLDYGLLNNGKTASMIVLLSDLEMERKTKLL